MSKYQKLSEHLAHMNQERWTTTFREIESILGFELPNSAYKYQAWWANQAGSGHSQTASWKSAGWRTEDLDIPKQRVTFAYEGESDGTLTPSARRMLTIAEAKAGLAASFGVEPEMIEITIKG